MSEAKHISAVEARIERHYGSLSQPTRFAIERMIQEADRDAAFAELQRCEQ